MPGEVMRFEVTPPPAPSWDKHLEPEVSAQLVTGCEQTKRELDKYALERCVASWPNWGPVVRIDPDPDNDGLDVVK